MGRPSADRSAAPGQPDSEEMAQHLDRMLDEALEATFPASDAVALPFRRGLEPDDA